MRHLASHYGWLIVSTLILVVVMSLASPLGMYMVDGFVNLTKGAAEYQEYVVGNGYETQVEEYKEMFASSDYLEPGLYQKDGENTILIKWNDLMDDRIQIDAIKSIPVMQFVTDENGIKTLQTNYDKTSKKNLSNPIIAGELVIKPSTQIIGEYCFAGLEALTSIRITNAQLIEEGAFLNCNKLKSITLGGTKLKLIEKDALKDCDQLTTIYFLGTYEEFSQIKFESQDIPQQIKVVCNDTTVKIKF